MCTISSDKSIPELGTTMADYQTEINQLASLVTSQVEFEQASHEHRVKNAQHALPCKEPRYDVDLFIACVNYSIGFQVTDICIICKVIFIFSFCIFFSKHCVMCTSNFQKLVSLESEVMKFH